MKKNGYAFSVMPEDSPDGFSNIDLMMNGERWEIKSPEQKKTKKEIKDPLRFVEGNMRKARNQFDEQYEPISPKCKVIFNDHYIETVTDEEVTERILVEMRRHGVDEVIQIMKDGSVLHLRR